MKPTYELIISNNSRLLVKATLKGYSLSTESWSGESTLHDMRVDTIWADWEGVLNALKQGILVDVFVLIAEDLAVLGKSYFNTYDRIDPEVAVASLSVSVGYAVYKSQYSPRYTEVLQQIAQIPGYAECRPQPKHLARHL